MANQLVLPASQRIAATMLDLRMHAEQSSAVLAGADRDAFLADAKLRYATMFVLVRIAEAANGLAATVFADQPAIDWPALARFTAERSSQLTDDDWREAWFIASTVVPTLLDLEIPRPADEPEIGSPSAAANAPLAIELPERAMADFCRRWRVAKLAVFGSALRDDFGPDSDVDFLVEFEPGASWSLFDQIEMQEELATLLGRAVDLIERRSVESSPNWIRRRAILSTAQPVCIDACSES